MPRKRTQTQLDKQQAAAERITAAVEAAVADAPKLTMEQAQAIVGLLLVNTEPPKAGWVDASQEVD